MGRGRVRICQLSHVETAFNFVAPLFTALATEGHEVVAASTLDHDGAVLRQYLGDSVELHRVEVSRKITRAAFTTQITELARYLRAERFDVLHLHGPLAAIQGRLAARLARVPVVISHAHGFYFHEGMRPAVRLAHVTAERWLGRHLTDYLITVNEEDRRFAVERGLTKHPAAVVGTPGVGIDTERFAPVDGEVGGALRAERGIPDDELVVTFVGRLVREKGVLELAAAFAGLLADRPAWLLLVGDVSPTERDQDTLVRLDELAARHPEAGRRTIRLGRRTDIPEILAATDVFVLPSHREGMPVSLMEAMSCGVAVITTDVRGCREVVVPGESGTVVPPDDAPALTEALRKLAADRDEQARLGAAARARIAGGYSIAHGLAPVVALYRRIEASLPTPNLHHRRLHHAVKRVLPDAGRRITVEHVSGPFGPVIQRPTTVLSEALLGEHDITSVADPFALHRNGRWYLFFEQAGRGARRGEIGLATSTDLASWTYEGVVLAEPFHVSCPHIVEHGGEVYMIPETTEGESVRLYRATAFPYRWELACVALTGKAFKDNIVLRHDGRWYLFSETSARHTNDQLRLFGAPELTGPWAEHPASPLVDGNAAPTRPAGRVIHDGERLVRPARSGDRRFGTVQTRRIELLTPTEYRESRAGSAEVVSSRHLDPHELPGGGWIRFVDGHR